MNRTMNNLYILYLYYSLIYIYMCIHSFTVIHDTFTNIVTACVHVPCILLTELLSVQLVDIIIIIADNC